MQRNYMNIPKFISEIKYQIGNTILKLPIVNEALMQNAIADDISTDSSIAIRHFLNAYKWDIPDKVAYDHLNSANEFLLDISEYQLPGGAQPSCEQYFDWMFGNKFKCVNDLSLYLIDIDGSGLPIRYTDERVYYILHRIFTQISIAMSTGEYKSLLNVYKNLNWRYDGDPG